VLLSRDGGDLGLWYEAEPIHGIEVFKIFMGLHCITTTDCPCCAKVAELLSHKTIHVVFPEGARALVVEIIFSTDPTEASG